MAYNNYFNPYYSQMPYQAQQTQNNGITWVQGENAAKSYPVASGQSVLLMDSEESTFYIKSTDNSGMPLPLRIFDYKERQNERLQQNMITNTDYISRSEFDAFRSEIEANLKATKTTSKTAQNKKEE